MRRILITGATGFLGREAINYFSRKSDYTIFPSTRQDLNLSDSAAVKAYVTTNKIDIIIHTAIQYGEKISDLIANLTMYENLAQCVTQDVLMIYYGSGAEYDHTKDVHIAMEEEVTNILPANYYALAKNLMTRETLNNEKNIINLRLFGCFGPEERKTRFVANAIKCVIENSPIRIHQNREMDFMYVGDIMKVTEYVLKNVSGGKINGHSDINMCYKNKLSLLDIANLICYTIDSEVPIIIEDPSAMAPIYTGDSTRLYELGLDFFGTEEGIKEVYNGTR
tara:strand:+ start:7396 stop:8235 length:840 start_codon:yes stop_codon:yes gene_type:complete